MAVQQEEKGKEEKSPLAVPPPPRRITSGIEVIWFVGHLGGGRVVLGPYRPWEPGLEP